MFEVQSVKPLQEFIFEVQSLKKNSLDAKPLQ